MRARKKLLLSCSLFKETIFRRGLDADRGIGDIVHRYLAFRRRMVFLLTTESMFQGCSGLFLNGSLPRHACCATRGHKRDKCDNGNKCDKLRFSSIRLFNKSEAMVPGRVGAGAVWRRVGTLASPLVGVSCDVHTTSYMGPSHGDACVALAGVAIRPSLYGRIPLSTEL
jgi:hypothetical protein